MRDKRPAHHHHSCLELARTWNGNLAPDDAWGRQITEVPPVHAVNTAHHQVLGTAQGRADQSTEWACRLPSHMRRCLT